MVRSTDDPEMVCRAIGFPALCDHLCRWLSRTCELVNSQCRDLVGIFAGTRPQGVFSEALMVREKQLRAVEPLWGQGNPPGVS